MFCINLGGEIRHYLAQILVENNNAGVYDGFFPCQSLFMQHVTSGDVFSLSIRVKFTAILHEYFEIQ